MRRRRGCEPAILLCLCDALPSSSAKNFAKPQPTVNLVHIFSSRLHCVVFVNTKSANARPIAWVDSRKNSCMQLRGNEFESGEHRSGTKRRKILFLVVPLHLFGSKSAISRFGERFRDGQYSLVSFLFAVLLITVPPCQPFVKVGARAPVPYGVSATACMGQSLKQQSISSSSVSMLTQVYR